MSIARPALKRLIPILLLLGSFPAISRAQTVVTGNVKLPDTTAPSNVLVCFTLGNYKPNSPRVIGTGTLVSQTNFCITPAADGSFSTSLYGNNLLTPTATTWRVDFLFNGQQQSSSAYLINHSPFNLDTETPLSVSTPAGPNQLVTQAFPFTQPTPATTWTIPHNFNDPNTITIATTSSGAQMFPDTTNCRTDPNNCILTFVTPTAGFAIAMHAGAINIATNQPNAIVANPTGAQVVGGGQSTTFTGPVIFSQPSIVNGLWAFNFGLSSNGPTTFSGSLVAPAIGPSSGQQHTIPTVTSDVFGLLAAVQTFSNKSFTGPTVFSNSNVAQPIVQVGSAVSGSLGGIQIGLDSTLRNFLTVQDTATLSNHHSYNFSPSACGLLNTYGLNDQTGLNCIFNYVESTKNLGVSRLNSVRYADQFAGATADVQINAAIADLPAGGGTVDARGYGATTQTIAATVNVGSNSGSGKTVTLLIDRTTKFVCTITNNTPCFVRYAGSTIQAFGNVSYPNAGLTTSGSAVVSNVLLTVDNPSANLVGGDVEGLTVMAPTGASVSDAICGVQNPLQVTHFKNNNCASTGAQNTVVLKIYCTAGNNCGNVEWDDGQIDGQGNVGVRPIWIGCAASGSITPVSCSQLDAVTFNGPGTFAHPGAGGLPIVQIEAQNGAGGTNVVANINFFGSQIESRNAADIGILDDGAESFHVYGLHATCGGSCGTDLIKLTSPAGTTLDGVDVRGIDNQGGWTNTLNNTATSRVFPFASGFARLNYAYSAFNRLANFVDGGPVGYGGVTAGNLGTPANGTFTFCSDCTIANPCVGGGTGAFAKRLNGVWVCN